MIWVNIGKEVVACGARIATGKPIARPVSYAVLVPRTISRLRFIGVRTAESHLFALLSKLTRMFAHSAREKLNI